MSILEYRLSSLLYGSKDIRCVHDCHGLGWQPEHTFQCPHERPGSHKSWWSIWHVWYRSETCKWSGFPHEKQQQGLSGASMPGNHKAGRSAVIDSNKLQVQTVRWHLSWGSNSWSETLMFPSYYPIWASALVKSHGNQWCRSKYQTFVLLSWPGANNFLVCSE